MAIPAWLHKWIEQLDDPAQNTIALTPEEDSLHLSNCSYRLGSECDCTDISRSLIIENSNRDDWE